jgi:hypothetical protein
MNCIPIANGSLPDYPLMSPERRLLDRAVGVDLSTFVTRVILLATDTRLTTSVGLKYL